MKIKKNLVIVITILILLVMIILGIYFYKKHISVKKDIVESESLANVEEILVVENETQNTEINSDEQLEIPTIENEVSSEETNENITQSEAQETEQTEQSQKTTTTSKQMQTQKNTETKKQESTSNQENALVEQKQEPTQVQAQTTQEKTETTPPQVIEKEETKDEEKYIRNDNMINKIKNVINNNPSEYMKTYGYEVIVDSSIKNQTNQFTFTETRVKAYIEYCFGTIKIYAEDYYKNGQLIMTECYIY